MSSHSKISAATPGPSPAIGPCRYCSYCGRPWPPVAAFFSRLSASERLSALQTRSPRSRCNQIAEGTHSLRSKVVRGWGNRSDQPRTGVGEACHPFAKTIAEPARRHRIPSEGQAIGTIGVELPMRSLLQLNYDRPRSRDAVQDCSQSCGTSSAYLAAATASSFQSCGRHKMRWKSTAIVILAVRFAGQSSILGAATTIMIISYRFPKLPANVGRSHGRGHY